MSSQAAANGLTGEFETRPEAFIMYGPDHVDWSEIGEDKLADYGLIGKVSTAGFREQYSNFTNTLLDEGIALIDLEELVDEETLNGLEKLNLMFTRDPATTIPWEPELFIPSNMSLPVRRSEPRGMTKALESLGMKPIIDLHSSQDQFAEGGDLYPIILEGKRTMLVGHGLRTSVEASKAIAAQLIPEVFDQVIMLEHDTRILHLDTGFTPLPNKTLFAAEGMLKRGIVYNRANRSGQEIDSPLDYFGDMGYAVVTTTRERAVQDEIVNMVPIGNNTFVGFKLDPVLKMQIQTMSGARIIEIPGDQIAPAQGGAHCLTRPVYIAKN
jgi:N-dimethylarginine dimethylaminohydrolase